MRIAISGLVISAMLMMASSAMAGDATKGKANYDKLCASCHGAAGKGDGAAAAALNPKPRNFSDKAIMAKLEDKRMADVISKGGAANGLAPTMPAWGAMLKDPDIQDVIAYVRTLAK